MVFSDTLFHLRPLQVFWWETQSGAESGALLAQNAAQHPAADQHTEPQKQQKPLLMCS